MTGSVFNFLFPIDGPALIDGGFLTYLFGLVIPVQRAVRFPDEIKIRHSDYVLCLNLDVPATFQLPQASTRRGKPLRFVDAAGNAGTFPVTLQPYGQERIVNWPSQDLVMATDYEIVTLWPFWDQFNRGWFVYPLPQGIGAVNVSDTPPVHPAIGTLWWDASELYVWTGSAWVSVSTGQPITG